MTSQTAQDADQEVKCPFAKPGIPNPHSKTAETSRDSVDNIDKKEETTTKKERCPWPFVFFHDPQTGMRDWQTWAVGGLVFAWKWKCENENKDRCPWPFVFFHDTETGMRDWQTWAVGGVALYWIWKKCLKRE